jgi:hypothetical protein
LILNGQGGEHGVFIYISFQWDIRSSYFDSPNLYFFGFEELGGNMAHLGRGGVIFFTICWTGVQERIEIDWNIKATRAAWCSISN